MSINQQEIKSCNRTKPENNKILIKISNKKFPEFSSKKNNNNMNDPYEESDQSPFELLSKILDTINNNSLNVFYPDSNNEFKKKIDSLNLEFYLETEKFLSNKNHSEKCQTSLFIILFKQINIYIEEIGRLNLMLIQKRYDPKKIIERTDEIIKKQNEFITKENLIKALKDSKTNMENKLLEAIISENKLKKEIEILKKEKEIYKSQINKNNIENCKINNDSENKQRSILHKITRSLLNEKNIITSYDNKKQLLLKNETRKRNNSDSNKFILSNSLNKLYKKEFIKFKIKNHRNIEKKHNNNNNPTIISSLGFPKKRRQIFIQLNEENFYLNPEYKGFCTDSNKMQTNLDNNDIKYIKTEYKSCDINNIKKGGTSDINNNETNKNKFKKTFISKSKEINYNIKEKDKKNKERDKDKKNNSNKDNKEKSTNKKKK